MRWTTRDGRRLYLSEMTTSHIRKCVSLLRHHGYGAVEECTTNDSLQPSPELTKLVAELDRRTLAAMDRLTKEK